MAIPLIAAAAMGLGALGKVLGGVGANSAKKAEARALEAGARQAREEAGVNASLSAREAERVAARGATLAASGGGGLTGSALDVLDDLRSQGVFNARRAVYEGEMEARNKLQGAATARQQGKIALLSGLVGAVSTVAGGFAQAAQARAKG